MGGGDTCMTRMLSVTRGNPWILLTLMKATDSG